MRGFPIALMLAGSVAACSPAPTPAAANASQPAASQPAAAQPAAGIVGLGQRPAAFAGTDPSAYAQWLAGQATQADQQDAGAPCPAVTITSLGASLGGPPIMQAPPPGTFIDTTVVEHLQVQGCGHANLVNFLVFRLTTGAWMAYRMLDGTSHTGAQLQRDALQTAVGAFAAGAGSHCATSDQALSTMKLGPARLLDGPSGAGGVWDELWTASVCGQPVTIKMTFTPDQGDPGTSFSATIVQPGG